MSLNLSIKKTALCLLFLYSPLLVFAQSILLKSDRLFDGTTVHQNYGVLVEGNKIIAVDKSTVLSAQADSIIDLGTMTLMPGMIEAHSHVLLYPYNQRSWNGQVLAESHEKRAIRGSIAAKTTLLAGFTSMRDLGSEGAAYADVAVRNSINDGIIFGPRLYVAGPAIVATGSYGPKLENLDNHFHKGAQEADGQDLIRVTREQIGNGADVVKVYADYRWGPIGEAKPTFSLDELKLIVETAASSGRYVAAHASTPAGIRRSILAGAKTIEHGDGATDEILELMNKYNVALCPTLAATYSIAQYTGWKVGTEDPERIKAKKDLIKRALKADVTILAGGDVGVFNHGQNVLELELMVEYGIKTMDVLKAVTRVNAQALQLSNVGELKEGFYADIIAVDGKPDKDIHVLRKVSFVMKDGVIYKND